MATYIDNIVKFHTFSKSPVHGTLGLGDAVNPSGHTVTSSQVRTDDIPWFIDTFQGNKDAALTWLAENADEARHNDIAYYGAKFKAGFDKPQCLIYVSKKEVEGKLVDLPAEECGWQDFSLKTATTLKNSEGKDVIAIHKNCAVEYVDGGNNASTNSNRWSMFVKTADGRILDHFVASTDKIHQGMPSSGYNALVLKSGAAIDEGELDNNYIGNTFAGIIHFNSQQTAGHDTNGTIKVTCYEYIGDKLDTTLGNIREEIQDIVGVTMEGVVASVTANDAAQSAGINVDSTAKTSPKITFTEGSVTTGETKLVSGGAVAAVTDALSSRIAQLEGIAHFSVVVVPDGQTIESVTPLVENTIYLVKEANTAEGTYIEYIAYKPAGSETVVTEKIGSTAIDLSGYTTDDEHTALADRVTAIEGTTIPAIQQSVTDARTYAEQQASAAQTAATTAASQALATARGEITQEIAAAKSGAESTAASALSAAVEQIGKDIEAAKSEAISKAEVTITAGTGIVVTPEGKGTTFEISVSDAVATAADLTALTGRVSTLETTTVPGIDTRLQAAEATITSLTSGDASVDAKISAAVESLEGQISQAQSTLAGDIDGVAQELSLVKADIATGATAQAIAKAQGDATQALTDAAAVSTALDTAKTQTLAQTGTLTGMFSVATAGTVGTGITGITITDSGLTQAIADAKSGAEQTAATALSTARGEITTEIGTAISGVEGKSLASTSTGSDLVTVTTAGTVGTGMTTTVDTTALATAISTAESNAISAAEAAAKAMTLSATDTDDAGKVTVTLGGTVETPSITVTTSDIASAQTLSDLVSTVNTHISEAAGLYLSVEKVDTLPADADAKTNKIYLVPVDTEAGREQNIHTEYIWTNNKWEIIGTTAIDINSLEAAAEAAQSTADTALANAATAQAAAEAAQTAADKAQGEVDALENVVSALAQTHADDKAALEGSITGINDAIAAMDADLTVNGISVKQVDGTITELSESLITASVPAGTTSVEGNVAYVGSTKHVIAPDKFQTAAQMPSTLTSWVADLSNLTDGTAMFKGCTGLTTFVGDLSSLETADEMFYDCELDAESLEILSENLPTVTSGNIDIGNYVNATDEVIATIHDKGWTVTTNGRPI